MFVSDYLRECAGTPKHPVTGCQYWRGRNKRCYFKLSTGVICKYKWEVGARVVLSAKLGRSILPGHDACHSCDNPGCINSDHIWEGTRKDNMEDAAKKNRVLAGEVWARHHHGLTASEVKKIIRLYAKGDTSRTELSIKFEVHPGTIDRVIRGDHWSLRGNVNV